MNQCEHLCSGNCRRVGCNCECGEWHNICEPKNVRERKYNYWRGFVVATGIWLIVAILFLRSIISVLN